MDGYRTLARLGLVAGLVAVELYLARDLATNGGVVGYTQTRSYAIAPAQRRAVVRSLAVRLGAPVSAGQLIAELDTTELDRELEAATAERTRAIAAIAAEVANARRTSAVAATQIASTSERANAEVATAIAHARTAAAELAAVETELAEQKELVRKRLADASVLNALELRRAALAKQVDTAEHVIAVLRGNATSAARRTADLPDGGIAATLAPLEAALRAVELRIDQLTRERAALRLVAPTDGVIDALPLRVGDLAGPDLPVATLVASDALRVVACVPELRANAVAVDVEAELTAVADRTHATGRVESVTSEIAPLPARCQPPGARTPA
ncbi:MAG: HlyD family efflux transporter periplasmic adaptor subunit, partial [Deltaproteobacteria bacterium]|nr:HlyD family efflux transporter periplasmic adaptor subunit [Deltaproteobacteria bacterium]